MSNMRQVGLGILAALVSVAILFGSLSLALMENAPRVNLSSLITLNPQPTATSTLVPTHLSSPSPTPSGTPTLTGTPSSTITASPTSSPAAATDTPTISLTPSITPTPCHIPSGWSLITVHSGDTLDSLAAAYNTTPNALVKANCLSSRSLSPGDRLYVPVRIAPTQTPVRCVVTAPAGWVNYTVQLGDTLYSLAQLTGTTVQNLMAVNCLYSDNIYAGQHLYIPHSLATPTKAPTSKPGKTPKPPTSTPISPTPTTVVSPTNTPVTPPSDTPVPPPSNTPVPPPSNTPVPPPSNTPVPPPSNTPVPPPSDTPVPPPSDTPVPPDTPGPIVNFALVGDGGG